MITHYDLFAGIGGFSLSLEEVFTDEPIKHIFCEWEKFPTAVLKQHWPDGEYWGDIADLVADTERKRLERLSNSGYRHGGLGSRKGSDQTQDWTILTGGFPCQPFSHAGRRKGTADDRYQWPNMYEVIRNTKPDWVIAENVRGLVTWNDGMVFEQVCADLESEGYETRAFIIPAVAKNAPHRRDRVWIIANRKDSNGRGNLSELEEKNEWLQRPEEQHKEESGQLTSLYGQESDANTRRIRRQPGSSQDLQPTSQESERPNRQHPDWSRSWQEVAFATCDDSVDDGLSRLVDGVPYSRAKWRKDSLKAYGNGIVSQVAVEIMKAIKTTLVKEVDNG